MIPPETKHINLPGGLAKKNTTNKWDPLVSAMCRKILRPPTLLRPPTHGAAMRGGTKEEATCHGLHRMAVLKYEDVSHTADSSGYFSFCKINVRLLGWSN